MRNIKITALLLAVLMVVSAFAGCASKTAVSDLENKVQEQGDALAGIQNSIKDLADAIANQGSSSELDDIKEDVAENKQNVADILAAIESLKDAVAGATGESEDVKTAINQAGAKIDALKDEYAANKAHYTAEDYATIVATLGAAQAAISTCVTAEAVAAELATMTAALDKCVRVDDSIYAYYVALKGNITDKSADLAEEAEDALAAAVKFYKKADLKVNPLEAYETEEDDEFPLAEELEALIEAQTGTGLGTLDQLKKDAAQLVKDIDEAAEKFDEDALEALYDEYRDFVKDAKKLSEENVALVTNADKLTAALASAENISAAIAALDKAAWEITSLLKDSYGNYVQIFADYNTLAKTGKQAVFTFESAKKSGKTLKSEMALTVKIYDAIDDKLAELAEDYELTDAAVAFVVDAYAAAKKWGEEYYARYEADKALVKAFEAEYEKLSDGIFADIKDLASTRLTAASALDLVEKYEANRDAINKWAADLVAAYKAEYKALKDKDTVNFTDATYPALVEDNFSAMAVAAELGDWEWVEVEDDEYEWKYVGYNGGLDDSETNFYYDLYAFDYAADEEGEEGALGKFLRLEFPTAYAAAKKINAAIKDFKVDQANSIVDLVVKVGGYYTGAAEDEETGKVMLAPIAITDENKDAPYVKETIADFVYNYKGDNYDLSGMIDVALYNEKLAGVEKAIEDAEKALAELVASYKALLGENNNVIVTMDNADEIIKLEALLIKAKAAANVNVLKAIVDDTKDGLNVYELKAIITDYLAEGQTATEFYNEILLSTDYADTEAGKTETGAITRLVYQAKALKREALFVESAYKVIKSLNDATGGKAFAYTTLNDAAALLTKLNATEGSLSTDAYLYGIFGFDTAERKTSAGATEYQTTAKMVRFNKDTGFYQGSLTGSWSADKNSAIRSAIAATRAQWAYNVAPTGDAIKDAQAFYDLMFGTIVTDIKTTDSESLSAKWGASTKFFPGYTLPMIATYLEAKFIINNMGKSTAAIDAAKAGWGEATSNYGFEYNKAMVANMLRVGAKLDAAELATIGNALNYSGITRAILNINEARAEGAKITFDIAFGHADASWISETYDITKVDYATGGALEADEDASTYLDHGIKLEELVVDVISIWDYVAPEASEEESSDVLDPDVAA